MKINAKKSLTWLLIFAVSATPAAWAKRKKKPEPVKLTESGEILKAAYEKAAKELKAEIEAEFPEINTAAKKAYLEAREAEVAAIAVLDAVKKEAGNLKKGKALVGHAKGKWIGGAKKAIAKAQENLKNAKSEEERTKAKEELANAEKSLAAGEKALVERQALLRRQGTLNATLRRTKSAYDTHLLERAGKAKEATLKALEALKLDALLASDDLDLKLAKYQVLANAKALAAFAQQGDKEKQLIEKLLSSPKLMIQMAVADGAKDGNYGQAMQIYRAIQEASDKAASGVLQNLAMAISLEHATPISQRNPKAKTDAPKHVDPVKRYLHYEKAFLDGELDEGFKGHTAWELRFVVNGSEPDETLAWGREMLRNYRPDHITTSDYRWRYVAAVRTDIRYGSQCNKFDKDDLQFFQNILMNGGICGRRAFFGRFILRAFGVPTTARPQPGHAALAHWTPDGWVVCLGGGWGAGSTKTPYKKDRDFLANTQARENESAFMKVKRAQWIGNLKGEKPVYGFLSGKPEFWHGIALYIQQQIIQAAKAVELAAVGTDIGEANESKVKEKVKKVQVTAADRKIIVQKDGSMTIPAVATSNPTNSTQKIKFMASNLGGMQLHYERNGKPQNFEYTFNAPEAGKYALTARVVTPSWRQILVLQVNDAKEAVNIDLPFTVGMWDTTTPVEITLKKGENRLTFSRSGDYIKGLTIKEFYLKPVK